jgi:hypothetical protein
MQKIEHKKIIGDTHLDGIGAWHGTMADYLGRHMASIK